MSKRWKPTKGEHYFVLNACGNIEVFTWRDDSIDRSLYTFGNCLSTRAEAKAAAEKVKALLLSLHDNDKNLQVNIQDMVTNTCQAMDRG